MSNPFVMMHMGQSSVRAPRWKYVLFDLPFVLFLRDSMKDLNLQMWAEAYLAGESKLPYTRYAPSSEKPPPTIVGGGLPVYLPPDELAPLYEVAVRGGRVGLQTLRRVNAHRPTVLHGEMPGDRNGHVSFSSVAVIFDMRRIRLDAHDRMAWFCATAVAAVNHFIEHYRVLADRPYVNSITMSQVQEFHIDTVFEDGTHNQQEFGIGDGPLRGFGGAIPDDVDQVLREAVATPELPPIHGVLDANIRDLLDLQDWRLVIIEAAILFEAWLTRYLKDRFLSKGVDSITADSKFVRKDGTPQSVTWIARNLVREATGFDFEASAEFGDWAVRVRDKRNGLVHGRVFVATKDEGASAYEAVRRCITLLEAK